MESKYILIFAKTPHSKTPYDQWLRGTGIEPIILAPQEFADGYQHLQYVFSFTNYDSNQLVEKTAYELAQKYPLVGVFARAEADILRAAYLRELLGLPGQKVASAIAYRNKVLMKNSLQNTGLNLPSYSLIRSAYDVLQFVRSHGYPVVIKPTSEFGSFGTHIIENEEELQKYLASPFRCEMEIETFVEGQMYHVDGLIVNKKIVFIQPFQYINDCLSFRKNDFVASCSVSPTAPVYKSLVSTTRLILETLPASATMAFHAELWVQKDGKVVFCEIASRTGGGMISSIVNQIYQFNIDQEWLYAECGISRSYGNISYRPAGGINIPPQNGILRELPSGTLPTYVRETQYSGQAGTRYSGGVKSGLFLAGYVVDGDSEAEIKRNINSTAQWFAVNSKWELT